MSEDVREVALKAEAALADLRRVAQLWPDEERAIVAALEVSRRLAA